jgi:hypothetical protein
MIRITALLAVAAAALAGVTSIGAAPAATKKLTGSVCPGESIVLKKGAARVATIPARALHARRQRPLLGAQLPPPRACQQGAHKHLVDRDEDGHAQPEARRHTYVCDPHSRDMIGSFRVR